MKPVGGIPGYRGTLDIVVGMIYESNLHLLLWRSLRVCSPESKPTRWQFDLLCPASPNIALRLMGRRGRQVKRGAAAGQVARPQHSGFLACLHGAVVDLELLCNDASF